MNSEQAALLASILHDPDDDAPRLIYADWLECDAPCELLDADRAQFIRLQIRAEYLQACPACKRDVTLICKNDECSVWLIRQAMGLINIREWVRTPGLTQYLKGAGSAQAFVGDGVFWRRGFIDSIRGPSRCLQMLDRLRKEHPVRQVALTDSFRSITSNMIYGEPLKCRVMLKFDDMQGSRMDIEAILPIDDAEYAGESVNSAAYRVLEDRWPGVSFTIPGWWSGPRQQSRPYAPIVRPFEMMATRTA